MSLKRALDPESYNNLMQAKSRLDSKFINVTCIGLYNNGKSSLLNALIDDYENSTFKVSDSRETIKNKEFSFKNISYIDTPGLHAKSEDDNEAYEAILESDINLFIHAAGTGEFTKVEVEFLENLDKEHKDNNDFMKNTIFVITQIDKMEDKDVKRLEDRIQVQLKEIFGQKGKIIPVSSLLYVKGKSEAKLPFIKKSNMESLKSEIAKFQDKLEEVREVRKAKFLKILDSYESILEDTIEQNEEKLKELNIQESEKHRKLNVELQQITETLENKYRQLNNI